MPDNIINNQSSGSIDFNHISERDLENLQVYGINGKGSSSLVVEKKRNFFARCISSLDRSKIKNIEKINLQINRILNKPKIEEMALLKVCIQVHNRDLQQYTQSYLARFKRFFKINDPISKLSTDALMKDYENTNKILEACRRSGIGFEEYRDFIQDFNGDVNGVYQKKSQQQASNCRSNTFSPNSTKPKINRVTPLSLAVNQNKTKMIKLLADLGADVNQVNDNGETLLTEAMYRVDNPHTIKLLEELGLNGTLSTKMVQRQLLAHVWGIAGSTKWTDRNGIEHTVDLEGLSEEFALKNLSSFVNDFFSSRENRNHPSNPQKQIIQSALLKAFPFVIETPRTIANRVNDTENPQPHVMLAGTKEHCISMVIINGKLIVSNRGEGRKNRAHSTEVFKLPEGGVTEEMIKMLQRNYSDINEFNQMIDGLKLEVLGGYDQKDQKVGNCTWASGKAAFGALCRELLGDEEGRDVYKSFTTFVREDSLRKYCKSVERDEEGEAAEVGDMQILLKVRKKLKGKKEGLVNSKELIAEITGRPLE